MNFSDEELAALASGNHGLGVFFRLDVAPTPVRLWFGFGAIQVGANALDPAGAEYLGFGELNDLPQISQLINGAAERVDFGLSGVSGAVAATASGNDADAVQGATIAIGGALLDSQHQLIGPVHWFALYVADVLGGDQSAPSTADEDVVRTVTLSAGSRFTGRRRASYSYFSDADQQARYPGDKSCSLVVNYAHGFSKNWPVF